MSIKTKIEWCRGPGSVAAKLTRLHAVYKGAATKHADTLADECTKTAALLKQAAGGTGDSSE